MNEIIATILGILGTILTALASWAAQRIISFINKRIKHEKASVCIRAALDVITNVVKETYQTYVASIKGTEAWTEQTRQKAFDRALRRADFLLSAEVKDYLISVYGDLNTWLSLSIESIIYDLKVKEKQQQIGE